jgi:heat-inducible transcriptional repressor
VVEIEEDLTQEDLQTCANYLNAHFTGMTLAAIRARLIEMMGEEKALYDSLLKKVVFVGERAFAAAGDGVSVYLDGASNILDPGAFDDVRRMRSLFRAFEEKGRLVKILNACLSGGGVRVIIGHENPDPELKGMALVTASYLVEGEVSFGLGVMGSTRMEYARVVALVDQVARTVARTLQDLHS